MQTNPPFNDPYSNDNRIVEEILYTKSKIAFKEFEKINKKKNKTFVVAGGVAANIRIREILMKYYIQIQHLPNF